MELKEQANTFKLTMKLEAGMLSIYLMDFIEWVIYSKTFSNCGQINGGKMDLKEFYDCFALSEIKDLIRLRTYKFGTIVRHNQKYAFKIEKGGLLTAYLTTPEAKDEELVGTTLHLKKRKEMT